MENFTPVSATLGGAFIGLSATVLLLFNGRIAGISGIVDPTGWADAKSEGWKYAFLAGLLCGGLGMLMVQPDKFGVPTGRSIGTVALAGICVGLGTRLG